MSLWRLDTRLVLLSPTDRDDVLAAGRDAAERLGLRFEHRHTGLDPFHDAVSVTIRKKAA